MSRPTRDNPMPDLAFLIELLDKDLIVRWRRRAQKQALIEWRDRTQTPGLAERFEAGAAAARNYGKRSRRYEAEKGNLPDFVKTGSLRDAMKTRLPRAKRQASRDDVTTSLKYGGGALNFLTDVHGVTGVERTTTRSTIALASYSYARKRSGTVVNVGPGQQQRTITKKKLIRSGPAFADEFRRFDLDRGWIERRSDELFAEIVRGAVLTKGGRVRSSVYAQADAIGGDG